MKKILLPSIIAIAFLLFSLSASAVSIVSYAAHHE